MVIRKKIDELIALYSLEPDLKDIYVEGVRDEKLIEWILVSHEIRDVFIYPVDIVELDQDLLDSHGLEVGSNRSRVIALSAELARAIPATSKVVCIADRDHEDYLPSGVDNCFLEFTDYNSTELYLLQPSIIRKLVFLVLGELPLSTGKLIAQTVPILEDLYVIRLANRTLEWYMKWIDFTKYVEVNNGVFFDRNAFLKAYLLKNRKWTQRSQFETKVAEIREQLKEDVRFRVRGHDFMELLHYTVKKLRKCRKFGNVETFQGAFTGCLELETLSQERLFQRLLSL